MFINTLQRRFMFISVFLVFSCLIGIYFFTPIFLADSIIIPYSIHEFDICKDKPELWHNIKIIYIISYILSSIITSNSIYSILFKKTKTEPSSIELTTPPDEQDLSLLVGRTEDNEMIFLPRQSLYQNIFITGTIGTGKTSSAIYPFTEQLIKYKYYDRNFKLGMLILDVKGNYYLKVSEYAKKFDREDDLIVIQMNGSIKYNPLDKPDLKASVLANRLKTILTLFSKNNSESYWLDKATHR